MTSSGSWVVIRVIDLQNFARSLPHGPRFSAISACSGPRQVDANGSVWQQQVVAILLRQREVRQIKLSNTTQGKRNVREGTQGQHDQQQKFSDTTYPEKKKGARGDRPRRTP